MKLIRQTVVETYLLFYCFLFSGGSPLGLGNIGGLFMIISDFFSTNLGHDTFVYSPSLLSRRQLLWRQQLPLPWRPLQPVNTLANIAETYTNFGTKPVHLLSVLLPSLQQHPWLLGHGQPFQPQVWRQPTTPIVRCHFPWRFHDRENGCLNKLTSFFAAALLSKS